MHLPQKKEQFQIGYIKALSACAGFDTGSWTVDNDSIDVTLKGTGFSNSDIISPSVDIQLKATTIFNVNSGIFTFNISKKNYDDLRTTLVSQPRYLIILHLPKREDEWIEETKSGIYLKNKCYWYSLRGLPEKKNKTSISLKIPITQVLTLSILNKMMFEASYSRSIIA